MESNEYHWLVTTALVASTVVATIANLFLLIIFCRRRGLRTIPNRFIINLLITNLLSSLLLIPLLLLDKNNNSEINEIGEYVLNESEIISEINNNKTIKNLEIYENDQFILWTNSTTIINIKINLCYIAQSSISFVSTLTILSILLIGINQYFGVIHSLRYHFYINRTKSLIFIITIWFIAFIFCLFSWLTKTESSVWEFCIIIKKNKRTKLERIFNTIYAIIYFLFIILGPFIAICIIYICIYTAAHKNSERMRKSTSSNLEIQSTSEIDLSLQNNIENNNNNSNNKNNTTVVRSLTKLKHKLSNSSVFRYREETRAAKISVLVIFLVLFCYVPYGVTIVLNSDLIQIKTPKLLNVITLVLLILSNIMSPFLFAYRNRRVKREIYRLFGSKKKPTNSLFDIVKKPTNFQHLPSSDTTIQPFLNHHDHHHEDMLPKVIITDERKSILKRVCDNSWTSYKKCTFITVPTSCLSGDARGSFSSASTQISDEQ